MHARSPATTDVPWGRWMRVAAALLAAMALAIAGVDTPAAADPGDDPVVDDPGDGTGGDDPDDGGDDPDPDDPDDGLVPAPPHLPQTPRVDTTAQTVDLTFPVAGPHTTRPFSDDFLALRGGGSRLHAATDVFAPKHRPIHAAVGGEVTFAPFPEPSYGWMVSIRGDDGHRYAYVHLNNDTPARDAAARWLDDDDGGVEHAYAPRIVDAIRTRGTARGLRVERGELLGWVGDSGNAKGIATHLHFEIHVTDEAGEDYRINPFHSLAAALDGDDVPPAPVTAPGAGFLDVSAGATHRGSIDRMHADGVVAGCTADRYCPRLPITRGDLAAAVVAARGWEATGVPRFTDVSASDPNAAAIATVDEQGVLTGYGDGTFGPADPLSRAQLATMLVQAFDLAPSSDVPSQRFADVSDTGVHSANIMAARAAGLTQGCGDGSRYCGSVSVTREQIASFLTSALDRG